MLGGDAVAGRDLRSTSAVGRDHRIQQETSDGDARHCRWLRPRAGRTSGNRRGRRSTLAARRIRSRPRGLSGPGSEKLITGPGRPVRQRLRDIDGVLKSGRGGTDARWPAGCRAHDLDKLLHAGLEIVHAADHPSRGGGAFEDRRTRAPVLVEDEVVRPAQDRARRIWSRWSRPCRIAGRCAESSRRDNRRGCGPGMIMLRVEDPGETASCCRCRFFRQVQRRTVGAARRRSPLAGRRDRFGSDAGRGFPPGRQNRPASTGPSGNSGRWRERGRWTMMDLPAGLIMTCPEVRRRPRMHDLRLCESAVGAKQSDPVMPALRVIP